MEMELLTATLSTPPQGNGFAANIRLSTGVEINSAETYPTEREAMKAAARKLIAMSDHLDAMRRLLREEGIAGPSQGLPTNDLTPHRIKIGGAEALGLTARTPLDIVRGEYALQKIPQTIDRI